MEIDLTKVRSVTEKVMIDKKFGVILPPVPANAPFQVQADVWKAGPDKLQDDNVIATIRSMRDLIAQVVTDVLTDTTSTGLGISVPGTFGGGNKTPGLGDVLLRAPATKKVTLAAGLYNFRVTQTAIEFSQDNGATWINIFSLGSGSIEWSATAPYTANSWVSYNGKLYKSLYSPNLGKTPGTNYAPPSGPPTPTVPWWLLFTEQIGGSFVLPNTILSGIPDGSITDIKISAVAGINVSKLANGTVSNTEFQYLQGLTSGIQGQLNSLGSSLSGKMSGNTPITPGTATKVTYDAKGLVTAGDQATTADIADSTNKRYVSDASLTKLSNLSGTNTGDETQATIKTKLGNASGGQDGYITAADWSLFQSKQAPLGFTPENSANKSTDGTLGGGSPSNTKFPTEQAVKTYVDAHSANEAIIAAHVVYGV